MISPNSDTQNRATALSDDAEDLLKTWRGQRAFRVGRAIGQIGVFLGIGAIAVDVSFHMSTVVILGAFGLLLGSLASVYFSNTRKISTWKVWSPLYAGAWLATFTCLWATGGLYSPFIGTFLSLLCVGGMVVQNDVPPRYVTGFIFLNLLFWATMDALSIGSFGTAPRGSFIILINIICFTAIMACVFEFLKTERTLAKEILHRYQELAQTREDLSKQEAASSAKSSFLANVSHELRTPLGAIVGYAELLQDSDLNEEEREMFAKTIFRNGQSLARLVNDILDLSKVEAGRLEVEKLLINPKNLVAEVTAFLAVSAEKKGIQLRLTDEHHLPTTMVSDPLRFKQILTNVVSNAIKFTEKGSIEIRAIDVEQGLRIEVIDSGRGMSEEEQERLFQPFSQADSSITRKFGGTGLGLNLSKSLAHLLGGDLKLGWSTPGVGSCFVIQLPLMPPKREAPALSEAASNAARIHSTPPLSLE